MQEIENNGGLDSEEGLISQQLQNIKENKGDIVDLYWNIYVATDKILKYALKDNFKKGAMVDIRSVVKCFGLEVSESEMHSNRNYFENEVMGFIDVYKNQESCKGTIYINRALGDLSKRYVIAHEFAHYFFRNMGDEKRNYCIKVLFPGTIVEQFCDIMAAFLLMPIESVLILLKEYVDLKREEGVCPVPAEGWMRYLGYNLKVSDYHVVVSYQHVLYLGGILRDKEFKGNDSDDLDIFVDMNEYKELLC